MTRESAGFPSVRAEFADPAEEAVPVHVIGSDALAGWLEDADTEQQNWVTASGFTARLGTQLPIPDRDGGFGAVLAGWGSARQRARGRHPMAAIARKLPPGAYRIASGISGGDLENAAYDWLVSQYRFDMRREPETTRVARLVAPEGVDARRIETMASAEFLVRDLINAPASHMGPDALETAFRGVANAHGAEVSVVAGDALLDRNLPLVHAVGRASDQPPRLLEMNWGDRGHPAVALVGKGVCFDTGGLNLKSAPAMRLMKKDMGGAATVIGLADMIMAAGLPLNLRVLVPAVENAVSGSAFRPRDVLVSRKGLSVEIGNTDAEGRLILADALALADEASPEVVICMATLTGAARTALGYDIVPFFTDSDGLAEDLMRAASSCDDPQWRMPFWDPYEEMIEAGIADLDNAPEGGAGALTAALFLRRFIERAGEFVHFDIYGWSPESLAGGKSGGACQSARALFHVLECRYGR